MSVYRLTRRADEEIFAAYLQGFERFGEQQADRYHDDLHALFQKLADNPGMTRVIKVGERNTFEGRRDAGDLIHDLRRIGIVHVIAHGLCQLAHHLPLAVRLPVAQYDVMRCLCE